MENDSWKDRYKNGSPYDRGSADRYYRRGHNPHWYPNGTYTEPRIGFHEMTPEQREEYDLGWMEETGEKDYG
jgi:hypothetical protein